MKSKITWPVVGHEKNLKFLEDQLTCNTLSHAYLFLGPPSLGKYTIALHFTKVLLCQEKVACGKCLSCQEFEKGVHPDLHLISSDSPYLSIDKVREIRRKIFLSPSLSDKKVVIFEEASLLTPSAQNALLKTLEEPPLYAILILVAAFEKLFPTILSRCTILNFRSPPLSKIEEILIKKGIDKNEAKAISFLSAGQIGWVLKDPLFSEKWKKNLDDLIQIQNSDLKEKMDYIKEFDLENLNYWLSIFEQVLLRKTGVENSLFIKKEEIQKLARHFTLKKICQIIKKIQEAQKLIFLNINQRLLLENLIMEI